MADSLSEASKHTVRQVMILAVQRLVQIAAAFLYAALIPRTMGPAVFGQYSTVQNVSYWFTMMSGLGAVSLMTRFVPEFMERGDHDGLRKLSSSLFTLRLGTGLLGACLFFFLVPLWLRELDSLVLAAMASTITLRVAANLPFTLLLGLNQASRWGAAEMSRRILLFPLTYGGFLWDGLRGACFALVIVEATVLALGLWWTRDYVGRPTLRIDRQFLKPYLQFSAVFYAGNVLVMFFQQGGTPLVRLVSGNYTEAGYYAVAFGAYLSGAYALWKLMSGFGPLFSSLLIRGETAELEEWAGRLLRLLAVSGVGVAAFLYAFSAMLVPHILGPGFDAVIPMLPLLALTGLVSGPGTLARILAVSFNLGAVSNVAASVQLGFFAGLGWLLIPRFGGLGACIAAFVATAAFSWYGAWRIRRNLAFSIAPWVEVVAWGALASPALWAWSAPAVVRFGSFLLLFLAAMFARGQLRVSEAKMLLATARGARKPRA